MSNFCFPLKNNFRHFNKLSIPTIKNNYVLNLHNNSNNNFQFKTNYSINASTCDSCPKDIKHNNTKNINFKSLKNELHSSEKKLEHTLNNKQINKPCIDCDSNNIIGFQVKNENDNYKLVSNPKWHLSITEDYHFENIIVLDKNNNYILLDKNMISNNSNKKLIINMSNDFYNNLRMPLILMAECVLNSNNITFIVNGFIV
jgi:hypothetical protein